jgi:hypothetical protein
MYVVLEDLAKLLVAPLRWQTCFSAVVEHEQQSCYAVPPPQYICTRQLVDCRPGGLGRP